MTFSPSAWAGAGNSVVRGYGKAGSDSQTVSPHARGDSAPARPHGSFDLRGPPMI